MKTSLSVLLLRSFAILACAGTQAVAADKPFPQLNHPDPEVRAKSLRDQIWARPKDTDTQVAMVRGLLDPEEMVRKAALEALGRVPNTEAGTMGLVAMLTKFDHEPVRHRPEVRKIALEALSHMRGPVFRNRGIFIYRAREHDPDPEVREAAIAAGKYLGWYDHQCENLALDEVITRWGKPPQDGE